MPSSQLLVNLTQTLLFSSHLYLKESLSDHICKLLEQAICI